MYNHIYIVFVAENKYRELIRNFAQHKGFAKKRSNRENSEILQINAVLSVNAKLKKRERESKSANDRVDVAFLDERETSRKLALLLRFNAKSTRMNTKGLRIHKRLRE